MLATGKAATAAPSTSTAPRDRAVVRARAGVMAETLTLAALFVVALAVRLPNLAIPRFRDETFSSLRALDIYRGRLWPLTDTEQYIGPIFNYIVALGYAVIGPMPYVARQVTTLFGAATVSATYLMGREVGGAPVGLVAAGLLLLNGVQIAALGHVGFSAHIAPFFATVGFWLLHRAVVRDSGKTLSLAGLFLGLALHTHPTTVGLLPGALGWFLTQRPRWLRTRWPYLAALLFLVAYSPLIVFNIQTGGESIRHALYTATERPDYARGRSTALSPATYLERQSDYWMMSYRMLGGGLDERQSARDFLTDPALLAMAALSLGGVLWAARRGYSLPLWLVGSFALILPLANANHYDVVGDANYLSKALPPIYCAVGLLVVDLATGARHQFGRGASVTVYAVVAVLALYQLVPLARYYAQAGKADPSNASLIRTSDQIHVARQAGDIVVLDSRLNDRKVDNASDYDEASSYRVVRFMLELRGIPYEAQEVTEATLAELQARGQPAIIVLSAGLDSRDTARLQQLVEQFGLVGLDGKPERAPRPADRFGLFRMQTGEGR